MYKKSPANAGTIKRELFALLDFFDDFVFAVDADDGRFPGLGFFRGHRCISYDNYEVTRHRSGR